MLAGEPAEESHPARSGKGSSYTELAAWSNVPRRPIQGHAPRVNRSAIHRQGAHARSAGMTRTSDRGTKCEIALLRSDFAVILYGFVRRRPEIAALPCPLAITTVSGPVTKQYSGPAANLSTQAVER